MAYKPQQWKVSKCLCNMVEEISSLQIQFPSCQYDGRKAKYMIQAVMVNDWSVCIWYPKDINVGGQDKY